MAMTHVTACTSWCAMESVCLVPHGASHRPARLHVCTDCGSLAKEACVYMTYPASAPGLCHLQLDDGRVVAPGVEVHFWRWRGGLTGEAQSERGRAALDTSYDWSIVR